MKKKFLVYIKSAANRIMLLSLLFIAFANVTALAQSKKVSGKVTAEDGSPLSGVSVRIKGHTGGTVTGADGVYSLSVPAGATLQFSIVGYSSQEAPAGDGVDLKLVRSNKALDEVVVVAYGTQKRKDLTGSIASVSADQIEKVPVTTIDQAMQGRAAGVNVVNNDGAPGTAPQIQIRGIGSLGGTDPLYVVDGYPISGGIGNINPNDIASIDILKDASATAIYGDRASNGVVIVTTKRGTKGTVQLGVDAYEAIETEPKMYKVATADQWATLADSLAPIDGFTPLPVWSNPAALTNLDWQKAAYQTGLKQNYNVSLRGGGDKVQTAFSAGYFNQKGIVLGSYYKRYNFSLNLDYSAFSWLKSSSSFKYARGDAATIFGTGGQGAGQGLSYLTKLPPTMTGNNLTSAIEDAKGNFGFYTPTDQQVKNWGSGPIYAIKTTDQQNGSNYFLGSSSLEATVYSGLKIKTNFGINTTDFSNYYFTPTDIRAEQQYGVGTQSSQNSYSQNANNTFEWVWENTISYDKTFGDHTINFVGGISSQDNTFRQIGANGTNLPSDGLRNLGDLPTLNGYYGNQTTTTLESQFGRIHYGYKDKYLLTATVRRDGSSKFAPGHQYGVFPSGSIAWRAKEESFLSDVSWLSDLKIRASYGQIGNQLNIGSYQFLSLYTPGSAATTGGADGYPFGKSYQPGLAASILPNPNLTWETSDQTDIGADIGFMNGNLTVTADYYDKKSKNFLLNVPVPSLTGFTSAADNVGSLDNKGIEIALNYHHSSGDFSYNVGFNITTVKNTLLSLTSGLPYVNNLASLGFSSTGVNNWVNFSRTYIGGSVGDFYGYKALGVFQTQKQIDDLNATAAAKNGAGIQYQPSAQVGDHYYADINGDGKVDNNDQIDLGSPIPKFYGGFNFDATYKNFDFNAFFNFTEGNKIFDFQESTLESFESTTGSVGTQNFSQQYYYNRWTPSNPSNRFARATSNDVNQNGRPSSFYVEDGSYIRFRNLQVGYTLPTKLTKSITATKIRFYVSAQNLFTLTGYSGLDPEIGSAQATDNVTGATERVPTVNGIDVGTYPNSKTFTFGVNVIF